MTSFGEITITNRTASALELCIEPEGQGIAVPPGRTAVARALSDLLELVELVHRNEGLSVFLVAEAKVVLIDGFEVYRYDLGGVLGEPIIRETPFEG